MARRANLAPQSSIIPFRKIKDANVPDEFRNLLAVRFILYIPWQKNDKCLKAKKMSYMPISTPTKQMADHMMKYVLEYGAVCVLF